MAALLSGGAGAVASHLSALDLWDLMDVAAGGPVHITMSGKGRPPARGIIFHRTLHLSPEECSEVDDIPVTSIERTLVDVAGMLGSHELSQIIATIERRSLLPEKNLRTLADRYVRRPGVRSIREVLAAEREPAFTRSEAERRCLGLIRTARLPQPRVNVRLEQYELDLYWPEERVAVEVDGFAFHGSRSSFEADRRKDGYLRSRGVEVVRLTWRQITEEPTATAVMVGQVLARASERRVQTIR
jgi:very-short-patch-repair endonuclease